VFGLLLALLIIDGLLLMIIILLQAGKGGGLAAMGGGAGILAALGLGRAAGSLLYELEGHDPLALVGSVTFLAVVSLAAGFIPAFKASRVDPMEALRYE